MIDRIHNDIDNEFKINEFNHLYYIYYLKIIINSMKDIDKTYNIVKKNGDVIRMKINEDKCGIMNNTKEYYTLLLKNIHIVDETNQQKYLGIELEQKVSVEKYCERVINEVQDIIYNICNMEQK